MAIEFDVHFPWDAAEPENPTEDEVIREDRWRDMMRGGQLGSGVWAGYDNELEPFGDSTGRQVKVKTGRGWFEGHFGKVTSEKTLPVTANSSGNPRIDRLVARVDFTDNVIELDVIAGTPASSPAAPALTQDSSVWELPIAQIGPLASGYTTIAAGDVTDERCLLTPYGLPLFPDAAALELWVPSAREGLGVAVLLDSLSLFGWDGSTLRALADLTSGRTNGRRYRRVFIETSGGDDDLTSGSSTTWPTVNTNNVAIPPWATYAVGVARIGQAHAVTDQANHVVRVAIGTEPSENNRIRWSHTAVTSSDERDIVIGFVIDVSAMAGTTVALRTVGSRVSGTGALRVDSESVHSIDVEFLETI